MALEIVTLRYITHEVEDVHSVSMTADLKLMSILSERNELFIYALKLKDNEGLKLINVNSSLWQEDIAENSCYKLLCIGDKHDLTCYSIQFDESGYSEGNLIIDDSEKWFPNFQNFLGTIKRKENPSPTKILAFNSKEAVIIYEDMFVVTFFLSSSRDPQIISFLNVSENGSPTRQISLIKETIFVLNQEGTVLSAFSVFNNSKVFEVDINKANPSLQLTENIMNFIVSLEKDIIVFYSRSSHLYYMTLEQDWNDYLASESMVLSATNVITAFAKQYPSIQSISGSNKRYSVTAASGRLQPVNLTCDTSDMNLQYVVLYNGKLCFLFCNNQYAVVGVHKLSGEFSTTYKRLENDAYIITGSSETFPLLLLYEKTISLLLYDIEHDRLVNEMMIYQCSAAAQLLSDLNEWQNIHMDMEALRQGLRNRQLHAVEFFLKTYHEQFKQVLYKKAVANNVAELKSEMQLWESIMKLLLETIRTSNLDRSACHFAKQLMEVVTALAIQLLDDVHSSMDPQEEKALNNAKKEVSSHFSNCLKEVRSMLDPDPDSDISDSGSDISTTFRYPQEISKMWAIWDTMSWQEVIKESLLNGSMALVQGYFLNHDDTNRLNYGQFEKIHEVGMNWVFDLLKEHKIEQAVTALSNLGVSVNQTILDIFRSTVDCDIRNLLFSELENRGLMSNEDKSAYDFILLLETLYPCTSFEHAQQILMEKNAHREENLKCAFPDTITSMPNLVVGNLIWPNENNCETGAYCQVTVNWVLQWSDDIKQRILAPHFLKGTVRDIQVTPEAVWCYLLENGDSYLVIKWISKWLGNLPGQSVTEFPYDWPINPAMINMIPEIAPKHVAEMVLNELAKHGVFCEEELEDISIFLNRVGTSQCNLNDPSVFMSEKSSILFPDLCHRLVHYSLRHNLIRFLYRFLLMHRNRFESWPTCNFCEVPLFRMIKAFSLWVPNKEDSSRAYTAMLSSAEHIYNVSPVIPATLLQQIPTPLNIGILLFGSRPLRETISNVSSSGLDIKPFKDALRSYPLLYDSLFESEGDQIVSETSVYQLLEENSPFDVSRLFGWQSTNISQSEDALPELPHFLMSTLSEQHGLKEPLTHFYYLMEGRPNFAYLKFMAQEIFSGNQLSLSRVRVACKEVFNFALSNFGNEKIASACVVFFEMLGQDSLLLRISLMNANFLFKQQTENCHSEITKDKLYQEISYLFKLALEDKEAASEVIHLLEAEVMQKYSSLEEKSTLKGLSLWMSVVALAYSYEVEVGDLYLQECAKNNEWLNFLTFAQIFQLPKEQVIRASAKFSNSCIGSHLCKALEKKSLMPPKESQQPKHREKDLRKSLYSRIGVPAVQETSTRSEVDVESVSMCSTDTSLSADLETNSEVIYENLFIQLLYSHKTDVPWITLLSTSYLTHNHVLSVLAASYADSDRLCCFTTWLACFLLRKSTQKNFTERQNIVSTWREEDLEKFIMQAIKENRIILLCQGVYLFLNDSPLLSLTEFLVAFLVYKKFDSSVDSLKKFQRQLWDYPKGEDLESPLHSVEWIKKISNSILKEVMINCQNSYEILLFLRHIYFSGLESTLSSEVGPAPSFNKLYEMVQYCGDIEEISNIELFLLPRSHSKYKNACWAVVKKLLHDHKSNDAKMFARVAGLSSDEVLLHQIELESEEIKKTVQWNNLSDRITFWKKILFTMKGNKLDAQKIIKYFKTQYDISTLYGEKCFLLQLIILTHQEYADGTSISEMTQLLGNMWMCCIREVKQKMSAEELNYLIPFQGMNNWKIFAIDSEQSTCAKELKEDKDTMALEMVINSLLGKLDIDQAFQVAKLFNHDYQELKIVETCLKLARGEVDPQSVNLESLQFSKNPPKSSRKMSLAFWTTDAKDGPTPSQMEVINCLEKLCNKSEVTSRICNTILVNFTAAAILNCKYDDLSKNINPCSILKNLLSSKSKQKFTFARNFITVYELSDETIAAFLSQEILLSIQLLPESSVMLPENMLATPEDGEEIIYNPGILAEGFQLLAKLCEDPSLIGHKLMNIVSGIIAESEISTNEKSLYQIVELCICAHVCYTVACNVEGISQVLRKCSLLVTSLAGAKKFKLIVRLLTGIGRYSEMSYVFDVLHEHREFELLLGKKMKEVPNLRSLTLALFDYIKRCHSADAQEYYSMFALNFSMHREIAEQLEMSARKLLSQLSKRTTDVGLKKELKIAMDDLADAAQSYHKGSCLSQAHLCAQLAKLVALQIYLLPSGTWIINLDSMAVSRCITEMSDFSRALIIAEAYDYFHCWHQALYYNVINKGNWDYCRDFQTCLGLSESLIEDVAKSYQVSSNKSENHVKNMKRLLSMCPNVEIKFKLANQLGFNEVAAELLMGDSGAFLQDLIATTKQM